MPGISETPSHVNFTPTERVDTLKKTEVGSALGAGKPQNTAMQNPLSPSKEKTNFSDKAKSLLKDFFMSGVNSSPILATHALIKSWVNVFKDAKETYIPKSENEKLEKNNNSLQNNIQKGLATETKPHVEKKSEEIPNKTITNSNIPTSTNQQHDSKALQEHMDNLLDQHSWGKINDSVHQETTPTNQNTKGTQENLPSTNEKPKSRSEIEMDNALKEMQNMGNSEKTSSTPSKEELKGKEETVKDLRNTPNKEPLTRAGRDPIVFSAETAKVKTEIPVANSTKSPDVPADGNKLREDLRNDYKEAMSGLNKERSELLKKNDFDGIQKLNKEIGNLSAEFSKNAIAIKEGNSVDRTVLNRLNIKTDSAPTLPQEDVRVVQKEYREMNASLEEKKQNLLKKEGPSGATSAIEQQQKDLLAEFKKNQKILTLELNEKLDRSVLKKSESLIV